MANRDAAEYKEAHQKPAGAIEKIPELMKQCISENWNGRVPTRDTFLETVTELACVAMAMLVKDGKLDELIGQLKQNRGDGKMLAVHCVSEALASKNERLTLQCCDLVFELGIQGGRTQQKIAHEHHTGKANVSAICTTLKETYTGVPGTGMKSNEAVERYASIRKGRRAKPMPAQWEFAKLFQQLFANERANKRHK